MATRTLRTRFSCRSVFATCACIVGGLALGGQSVIAQSFFDDGSGKGSITLSAGGRLDFELSDAKANLTFTNSKFSRTRPPINPLTGHPIVEAHPLHESDNLVSGQRLNHLDNLLFSLRGKPDSGSANLFSSARPGIGAGATFGYGLSYIAASLPSKLDNTILSMLVGSLTKESEQWKVLPLEEIKTRALTQHADNLAKAEAEVKKRDQEAKAAKDALNALVASGGSPSDIQDAEQRRLEADAKLDSANNAREAVEHEVIDTRTTEYGRRRYYLRGLLKQLMLRVPERNATYEKLKKAKEEPSIANLGEAGFVHDHPFKTSSERLNDPMYRLPDRDGAIGDLTEAIWLLTNGQLDYTPAQVGAIIAGQDMRGRGPSYDHWSVGFDADYDRFKLADKDANGAATNIAEKATTALGGHLAYNIQFGSEQPINDKGERGRATPILLGFKAIYGRGDNRSELQPVDDSGALLRSDYIESDTWSFNTDFAFNPGVLDNRIWLNVFSRNSWPRGAPNHRYGLGVFITEEKNPFAQIGGVLVSFSSHENLRVDLVLGFKFGG
jgi:hypothetical protein